MRNTVTKLRYHYYFYLILFFQLVFTITFSTAAYYSYEFGGDGYNYFNALRNLSRGLGFWEGPWYEHLLGNHSYFTLLLLLPFVAIFKTPLVLLYTSIFCWLLSSILFNRIANKFFNNSLITLLLSLFYATLPITVQLSVTPQIFQPDYFLTPAVLLLFYSLLIKNRPFFFGSFIFALLTKEEFIVMMPLILLWALGTYKILFKNLWLKKKDYLFLIFSFLCCTILASVTLHYYRELNIINFAVRKELYFDYLFKDWIIKLTLHHLFLLTFTFFPVLIYLLYRRNKVVLFHLLITTSIFLLGREFLNIIIYSQAVIFSFHTRAIIPPTLIISLVSCIYLSIKNDASKSSHALILMLSFGLLLNFCGLVKIPVDIVAFANNRLRHFSIAESKINQIEKLKVLIPFSENLNETLLVTADLAKDFTKDRNFVVPVIFLRYYDKLAPFINYGILNKNAFTKGFFPEESQFINDYIIVGETEDYFVIKKIKN